MGDGIRLLETLVLNGPNYWSYRPCVWMRIDLGPFRSAPRATIPGFPERLARLLPGLQEHHCSEGAAGGFLLRVTRGDLAWPRGRARRHRDPAGGRHLRLLRAHARDEDPRRLQPRLRDGGRAGRRAGRQARPRRRRALRGPGRRPRPAGLDRELKNTRGGGPSALRRGRSSPSPRARGIPLPAPERPLAS